MSLAELTDLITAQQLMELFPGGLHYNTVRNWRKRGKLPAYKIKGRWFFRVADVVTLIEESGCKSGQQHAQATQPENETRTG